MTPAVAPQDSYSQIKMSVPTSNTVVPACPQRLVFTREDFLSSMFLTFSMFDNSTAIIE